MKPIPQELIDAMPDRVEVTRESCEAAVDPVLMVLFLMGGQLEPRVEWPPIISNGIEVWPLPPPWQSGERNQVRLLADLNGAGDEGYLEHCRRNAMEFNEALEEANPELAAEIAKLGPVDSAHVWEFCNALAMSVCEEQVYQTLPLSAETKQAYYIAVGIRS